MPFLDIVLLVLLVGSVGALLWAVVTRARLAEAGRSAEAELERARSAIESATADLAETRTGLSAAESALGELRLELAHAQEAHASDRRLFEQRTAHLAEQRLEMEKQAKEAETRLRDAFARLSNETLERATKGFLELATERFDKQHKLADADLEKRRAEVEKLVKPIGETLAKTEEKLVTLTERIAGSKSASDALKEETQRLTRALSRPEVRGRYGEIQLRRVAELAGMTNYCDFTEQSSARDSDGKLQRPDMVVTLPAGRVVAVDAKTNIDAYLSAVNAPDDAARDHDLDRFANHVAEQARALSRKSYWSNYEGSPEFVVMFVPGDHFIDAALSRRPELMELAAEQNVILASPATLIGLLRAVAVGWREQQLTESAKELFTLGTELHERASVAFGHAADLGKSIQQAVERFNKLAGSIDSRLMPTLKKFEERGVSSSKSLIEMKRLDATPRLIDSAVADDEG